MERTQEVTPAAILLTLLFLVLIARVASKQFIQDLRHLYQLLLKHTRQTNGATATVTNEAPTASSPNPVDQVIPLPSTTDILRYLGKAFSNPETLIKGMAKNSMLLSGSRALDIWLPGSASVDSDFDFYVPDIADCQAGALQALADCGVVWDDKFTPLRDALASNARQTMHITQTNAIDYCDSWNIPHLHTGWHAKDDSLAHLIRTMSTALTQLTAEGDTVLVLANNTMIHIHPDITPYLDAPASDYGSGMNVVRGRTTFNGTSIKVQLISSPGKSPIDLILAFYASHVQCFVSAFGTAHLYFPAGKRGFTWPQNTQHRPSAEAALQKYGQRGSSFESKGKPRGHRDLRTLYDSSGTSNVTAFEWDFALDIPKELEAVRRLALSKLMWIETADRTWFVPDAEVSAGLSRWQRARRQRIIRKEDVGDELDGAAHQLLLEHGVGRPNARKGRDGQLGL